MRAAFLAGNRPASVPATIKVRVASMAMLMSTVGFSKYSDRKHACIDGLSAGYVIHVFGNRNTCHHAYVAKEGGNGNTFGNDEPEYRHGFGSKGFADAKFMRPLAYGDEHDIADSHNAAQQGKDSDNPDSQMKNVACRLLL